MAPRKSHLDCQETLLVQDNEDETATEEDQSLVSIDDPPVNDMILDLMYERETSIIINVVISLHHFRTFFRDQPPVLPFISFQHSVFDHHFVEGGQQTHPTGEPEAEPPGSDGESEDADVDKENQDPNGRSNIQAMALAREDQLPRQDDYFDVQVVTELEQLGNTWRQFMGGALRAPQQNSPSITELFSEPH